MTGAEVHALIQEADRLQQAYLDAYNRQDLETSLRIGADQLLPIGEQLAHTDAHFLDPLAITLRNLAGICYQLKRLIGAFYFGQRALDLACSIEEQNLPLHPFLGDVSVVVSAYAVEIVYKRCHAPGTAGTGRKPARPAVAQVPRSIARMRQLESFAWAAQLRVAATVLCHLDDQPDLGMLDDESQAMVELASFAYEQGRSDITISEIEEVLRLWIRQLDGGRLFWSTQLIETWSVAADLPIGWSGPSAWWIRQAIQHGRRPAAGRPDQRRLRRSWTCGNTIGRWRRSTETRSHLTSQDPPFANPL